MRLKKDKPDGRIERRSQEGPDMLNGNNMRFSMIEPSYDSHAGTFFLLISSLSPVDE
jgi:hypothetical protein